MNENPTIRIRKATSADVALLARLNEDVQREHVSADARTYKDPDPDAVRRYLLGYIEDPRASAFLAVAGERPVGYVLSVEVSIAENAFKHARHYIEVDHIVVAPDVRGSGIGRQLMDEVFRFANRVRAAHVELSVISSNASAIEFYRGLGFQFAVHRMSVAAPDTNRAAGSGA